MDPLSPSVHLSVLPSDCSSWTLFGCLVCVIYNSKRFHSFLFKLCIMIVHILKMCTLFCAHSMSIFLFLMYVVELRRFLSKMLNWCPVCVICNSNSCQSFMFKFLHNHCSRIEDVNLSFCAHLINNFLFLKDVELRHFSIRNAKGCLVCVICNSISFHSFIFKLL